jgi:hypothetical protein
MWRSLIFKPLLLRCLIEGGHCRDEREKLISAPNRLNSKTLGFCNEWEKLNLQLCGFEKWVNWVDSSRALGHPL